MLGFNSAPFFDLTKCVLFVNRFHHSSQVVINHNIPGLAKNYVHRVGRTARAGRSGMALSLVTQFDIHRIQSIEEHISKSHMLTSVFVKISSGLFRT